MDAAKAPVYRLIEDGGFFAPVTLNDKERTALISLFESTLT